IAPRYLYAFQAELNNAIYLNSPHTLVMEDQRFGGAADEAHFVPWALLRDELARAGRKTDVEVESYTVELGDLERLDAVEARRDAENLANYLRHHGVLSGAPEVPKMTRRACRISDYVVFNATRSGLTLFRKQPGETIRAGEVVAEIVSMRSIDSFDAIERAATPVVASVDGVLVTRHRSPVVMEGTELFKLMTNVWEL
ncbi:MAG TPA: succinylglutamate desuccinylase/aspartoacylase family protein, partial [Thermoanaerobaculia bacterium]